MYIFSFVRKTVPPLQLKPYFRYMWVDIPSIMEILSTYLSINCVSLTYAIMLRPPPEDEHEDSVHTCRLTAWVWRTRYMLCPPPEDEHEDSVHTCQLTVWVWRTRYMLRPPPEDEHEDSVHTCQLTAWVWRTRYMLRPPPEDEHEDSVC